MASNVLRTIRGYCLEWGYRYHQGMYINKLDSTKQFEFMPGCFDQHLAKSPNIALTRDLDRKTFYARTGDGTLQIESDDVGLLVTADLLDTPLNRQLCNLIDAGRVRGWSHRTSPMFSTIRTIQEGDIEIQRWIHAPLGELTLVISKFPRAKTRKTPIFLEGGPEGKVVSRG